MNILSSIAPNGSDLRKYTIDNPDNWGSPISIGRTVKNCRRTLRLSHKEFAQLLSVDFMWLSRIENDRQPIDDETEDAVALMLPKLAQMADVDLEWLKRLPIVYRKSSEQPAFVCRAKRFI